MALWKPGDADTESARSEMDAALVEAPNKSPQGGRILNRVLLFVAGRAARRIASERANVYYVGLGAPSNNRTDLPFVVVKAVVTLYTFHPNHCFNCSDCIFGQIGGRTALSVAS